MILRSCPLKVLFFVKVPQIKFPYIILPDVTRRARIQKIFTVIKTQSKRNWPREGPIPVIKTITVKLGPNVLSGCSCPTRQLLPSRYQPGRQCKACPIRGCMNAKTKLHNIQTFSLVPWKESGGGVEMDDQRDWECENKCQRAHRLKKQFVSSVRGNTIWNPKWAIRLGSTRIQGPDENEIDWGWLWSDTIRTGKGAVVEIGAFLTNIWWNNLREHNLGVSPSKLILVFITMFYKPVLLECLIMLRDATRTGPHTQ